MSKIKYVRIRWKTAEIIINGVTSAAAGHNGWEFPANRAAQRAYKKLLAGRKLWVIGHGPLIDAE